MRKLMSVHVLTTLDCNFRCEYCFVSHRPRYMTEHTLKKTLEFLVNPEVCDKQFRIEFFGGEPLMTTDLVLTGADYARELAAKHDMKVGIGVVSNMSLVTSDLLDQFKAKDISMLASFDGKYSHNTTRHPGSADLVAGNIKLTIEKGVRCMVAMQVVPGHLRELYGNFRSITDLGIKAVAFNPVVHGAGRRYDDEDWREMDRQFSTICDFLYHEKMNSKTPFTWTQMDGQLQAIHRVSTEGKDRHNGDWSCGACKGSMAVDPEGYIMPCHQMPSNCGYDEWTLGHVAVPGSINNELRSEFLKTKFEDCSQCAVLRCAPCRTINKATTGSEYERAPQMCQYQRLLFTHAVKLHNRLVESDFYKGRGV